MTLKYVARLMAIAQAWRIERLFITGLRLVSHCSVDGLTAPMVASQSASWTMVGTASPFSMYGRAPGTPMEANSPAQQKYWLSVPVVFTIRQLIGGAMGSVELETVETPDIFFSWVIWAPFSWRIMSTEPDCRASLRDWGSTMVLKLMPERYGRRRPAPSLRQYLGFFVNWDSTPTLQDLNLKGPVPMGLPA